MSYTYLLNYIAKKIEAKSYLEIGVDRGNNFTKIEMDYKVGVDPFSQIPNVVCKTSDEFFSENTATFDLIFIDGLHTGEQVLRDIENSLKILNKNGYIVCHDMLPYTEEMQVSTYSGGEWTGDCWKAFYYLRQTRTDLEMYTVDLSTGCGIIRRGSQDLIQGRDGNYNNFDINRHEWMNILGLLDFYKLHGEVNLLECMLSHYIYEPTSPEVNFYIGRLYHEMGQTASGVSFYLRAAERTDDVVLKYECLLQASSCFNSQGSRNTSVEGMIQHAIALLPTRPEGYYLLSRLYEHQTKWFDCYLIASLGEKVTVLKQRKLRTFDNYPGYYGILFQKAVSSWWCGLCDESRDLFKRLMLYYPLDSRHKEACTNNLKRLNAWKNDSDFKSQYKTVEEEEENTDHLDLYRSYMYKELNSKFPGSELIDRNYSESFQDMFTLTILNGKRNGTYVEIGGGYPLRGNNTYLLETKFDWSGLSIDITPEAVERHFRDRKHRVLCADATTVDYVDLFIQVNLPTIVDYLQLDCDPSETTYSILTKIPFDRYKFAVITYEHDHYRDSSKSYKEKSRKFLLSKGYELVVSNVGTLYGQDYEDWYVHPGLVNKDILAKIKNTDNTVKSVKSIFL